MPPETAAPPEFRRELIRQANRRVYNSFEVASVLEGADWAFALLARDGEYVVPATAEAVSAYLDMWEESFDHDVEP
jgi:hypothetical protein